MTVILRRHVVDQVLEVRAETPHDLSLAELAWSRFPVPEDHLPATALLEVGQSTAGLKIIHSIEEGKSPQKISHRIKTTSKYDINILPEPHKAWHIKVLTHQCTLAALSQNHLLTHGSAVASNGRAVLFVGGSGSGKTSLAMALHRQGLSLLTEGQIPIASESGWVQPFPRSLELVHSPKDRKNLNRNVIGKHTVQAPRQLEKSPCEVGWIFFLDRIFPGTHPQKIRIGCHPHDAEAFVRVLSEAKVRSVERMEENGLAVVQGNFIPKPGVYSLGELHDTIEKSSLHAVFVACAPLETPNRQGPPVLKSLKNTVCKLGLAANCPPGNFRMKSHWSVLDRVLFNAKSYLLKGGDVEQRARTVMNCIEEASSTKNQDAR